MNSKGKDTGSPIKSGMTEKDNNKRQLRCLCATDQDKLNGRPMTGRGG